MGQVRVRDRLKRGEAFVAELEDRNRVLDVFQTMLAQVREHIAVDLVARRLREHDLATVRRGCDTRCEMDVISDVALVGDERRARVKADAQVDRPRCKRLGHRLCCGY
jgi:hypothetical protein